MLGLVALWLFSLGVLVGLFTLYWPKKNYIDADFKEVKKTQLLYNRAAMPVVMGKGTGQIKHIVR